MLRSKAACLGGHCFAVRWFSHFNEMSAVSVLSMKWWEKMLVHSTYCGISTHNTLEGLKAAQSNSEMWTGNVHSNIWQHLRWVANRFSFRIQVSRFKSIIAVFPCTASPAESEEPETGWVSKMTIHWACNLNRWDPGALLKQWRWK